ncbi:MAG: UDP-N-acetylmuramoyl-tripeptide--D-alanyl-D-alanine ligase [Fusobacterium perfoetens]|uniref:UDP-N-acetylmuramoyl-tripeptide--D-alanyl-D- alanine ligase n=1 Tax=Fusobacterium perfoetens TaxID=852 RepID=UPI0023F490CF|nr:UDP-N-acetylmuramoyl-tripeptide--D-alanyl-D-alanine ligase [Fusobacterium perfoetens]MCI6153016.1 UDP-N-acetylmuramoyl-tripeptide--D-alanyl-D-alanine ligase [Fusobacterium perfoetens]MDY3237413.1 UDP-N-acetylmuramoyl-tripeptide--D-alanyl-D-alanine ligase [Fusobacterium perfoetens]
MKELLKLIEEKFHKTFKIDNISKVEIDSRNIKKGDLFFAINNGRNYIENVLKTEDTIVICDDNKWKNHERVIVVEDTIKAIQSIAKDYRKRLNIKLVGITGSEGKTTTKDIIHGILSSKYKTKKTVGNYNNHIGLPFTILQLDENDEFGVIEMGMSHKGEISALCDIANIDYGVITNIGDSHLEFMINRDNVFLEKSQIKNYISEKNFFIFGDDVYLKNLSGNKIGFNESNDFVISDYSETIDGVNFSVNSNSYSFKLNGKHNCINASIGIALGLSLGLTSSEIQKGLNLVQVTPMRFQKIEKDGILYINDAYNASPVSMKASLETFNRINFPKKKLAILADMGEMGKDEIFYHEDVLNFANNTDIDTIIILGSLMKEAYKNIKSNKFILVENKDEIKKLIKNNFSDRVILLKGSNFNHLWEII